MLSRSDNLKYLDSGHTLDPLVRYSSIDVQWRRLTLFVKQKSYYVARHAQLLCERVPDREGQCISRGFEPRNSQANLVCNPISQVQIKFGRLISGFR